MSNSKNSAKTEATANAAAPVKTPRKTSTAKAAAAAAVTGLKGTPAELMAAGVTLNGHAIDAGTITVLRKHFFGEAIAVAGYAPKPQGQKGKATEIVELKNAAGFQFVNPSAAVEA